MPLFWRVSLLLLISCFFANLFYGILLLLDLEFIICWYLAIFFLFCAYAITRNWFVLIQIHMLDLIVI